MKKIKTVNGKVIAESKAKGMTIKRLAEKYRDKLDYACLTDADLSGINLFYANDLFQADLSFAILDNTKLTGIKGYSDSHEIFFELCRRQPTGTFNLKELAIIGELSLHRPCWDVIKKRYGKTALSIAKKLAKAGWDEYYRKYKEVLK